jgi:hypothetical protein
MCQLLQSRLTLRISSSDGSTLHWKRYILDSCIWSIHCLYIRPSSTVELLGRNKKRKFAVRNPFISATMAYRPCSFWDHRAPLWLKPLIRLTTPIPGFPIRNTTKCSFHYDWSCIYALSLAAMRSLTLRENSSAVRFCFTALGNQ